MISVFEPDISQEDIDLVTQALKSGQISGTFGHYIRDFEEACADYCDCKYGVAVSSGTTALHLAVAALNLKPEDEVIVSAFTNIATALAVYHNQCITKAIDSETDTWNININLIESHITPKTKAIIPVHIYGHPVDMEKLMFIAKKHNLLVIEDAAEALGSTVNGQKTGSFGDMGCLSFYANKTITSGEGGMVVTNNEKLVEKLRSLRNLAFTQPRFVHYEAGYNFRMTGMQAALGYSQLSRIDDIIKRKREIAAMYNGVFQEIDYLSLPKEEEWAHHTFWMYCVTVKENSRVNKDHLCQYLRENGIDTRNFFFPINKQPFLLESDLLSPTDCPVAESLWEKGFYLPSSLSITKEQIDYIKNALINYPIS